MIALVLVIMMLADVPPVIDCIDPTDEMLILFYPASPVCPEHIVEVP